MTNPTSGLSSTVAQMTALLKSVAIDSEKKIVNKTPAERMFYASQMVENLREFQQKGVLHSDIKPDNALWESARAKISDIDDGRIIKEMIFPLMQREFQMPSEAFQDKMKTVVNAYQSKNEARINAVTKNNSEQIKQLHAWGILRIPTSRAGTATKIKNLLSRAKNDHEQSEPKIVVINQEKLDRLQTYLDTKFLPTKSTGFAAGEYTKAICDYFWQCNESNTQRACFAFDQRAVGIMLYVFFVAAQLPIEGRDTKDYYDQLEKDLENFGVTPEAVRLIRKMAEPVRNFDTSSDQPFPVPCTDDELAALQTLLLDASK